jgi:uncharacterized protein
MGDKLMETGMHKFKIVKTEKGEFRVQFVYNAEIMVWSENYASKASVKNCVESLKKNAPAAPVVDLTKTETGSGYRFEIDEAKNGETFVRFRAAIRPFIGEIAEMRHYAPTAVRWNRAGG